MERPTARSPAIRRVRVKMRQEIDGSHKVTKSREEVGDGEECDEFLGKRANLREGEEGEEDEEGAEAGKRAGDQRDVTRREADGEADLARVAGTVRGSRTYRQRRVARHSVLHGSLTLNDEILDTLA